MEFAQRLTAFSRSMVYHTPKYASIMDWRLATLNYALKLIIAIYVFLDIFRKNSYLETEVPMGRVSNWGSANKTTYLPAQEASFTTKTPYRRSFDGIDYSTVPCAGGLENYTFEFDEDRSYKNVSCAYLEAEELIKVEPTGGLFFVTHLTETVSLRAPKPKGGCDDNITLPGGDQISLSPATSDMICSYKKIVDWLTVGTEHTYIVIEHEFETMKNPLQIVNPLTKVRRPGNNTDIVTFKDGEKIKLSMAQILEVAQIDLDQRYEDQPGESDFANLKGYGSYENLTPMTRLAGLRINMNIKYYNYHLDNPNSIKVKSKSKSPYAILEISPLLTWTSRGQQITYRSDPGKLNDPIRLDNGLPEGYMLNTHPYGIHIDISSSGIIGHFNFFYLVNALVTGLVLLGVAQTICDLLAKYKFGTKSKIYYRKIMETVDFEREAAKYALQGIIATEEYRRVDHKMVKGDGISLNELTNEMKETFCSADGMTEETVGQERTVDKLLLTDDECRVLAMYIMRAGDRDAKERFARGLPRCTVEEMGHRKIDLAEWTELMTGEVMDVQMVKDCVKMDADDYTTRIRKQKHVRRASEQREVFNIAASFSNAEVKSDVGIGRRQV